MPAAYRDVLYAQHRLNAAIRDGKSVPDLAFIAELMAHPDSTGAYKDIDRTMFQRKATYLTKLLAQMESATANYALMVLTLVDGINYSGKICAARAREALYALAAAAAGAPAAQTQSIELESCPADDY